MNLTPNPVLNSAHKREPVAREQDPVRSGRDAARGRAENLQTEERGRRVTTFAAPAVDENIAQTDNNRRNSDLFEAAQKLEVSFLTELLKYSGFTKGLETSIGGTTAGPGASAFSNIYINDIAEKIVAAGGVGLAESFYRNLITSGAEHAELE